METKLYVGNLAFDITEDHLRILFTQAGTVNKVALMKNQGSGSSKGIAFVTMNSLGDGNKAIEQFHGRSLGYRELTVSIARTPEDSASSSEDAFQRVWSSHPRH